MDIKSLDKTHNLFTLKRWNLVGLWSWECTSENCAICRNGVMEPCVHCQNDNRLTECILVWGECNHVFHNCCISQWIKKNNNCPLCQQTWSVRRIGK